MTADEVMERGVEKDARLLTFRSGGWVLLLAGLLCVPIVVWRVNLLITAGEQVVGDGKHVASYGFDMAPCLVDRDLVVAAGFPKDGIPTLTDPAMLTPTDAERLNQELADAHAGRFLLDADVVVGVFADGESRAYPLRLLTWHEIVNDVLAGEPIAVTYSPLCNSVVVFSRRVGDEVLEFGASGLLYNSNMLMFDRREGGEGESLWSQLQFRAVIGPAAAEGAVLRVLPSALTTWGAWREVFPESAVLAPERQLLKVYKRSYGHYFGSEALRFPVRPLPEDGEAALKVNSAYIRTDGDWQQNPLGTAESGVGSLAPQGGRSATASVAYPQVPVLKDVLFDAFSDTSPPIIYSYRFGWYAHHGESGS